MVNKISVIVKMNSVDDSLNRCLQSLIKQTYKNIEIILRVNNECKEVKELLKLDNRIVTSDDDEVTFKGDYLFFINQDDYLSVDYFRLMMSNYDSDVIISNIVFDNGDVKKYDTLFESSLKLDLNVEDNKEIFLNEFKEYVNLGNMLISRELYLSSSNDILGSAKSITQNSNSIYYCGKNVEGLKYSIYSNELEELKNKMLCDEFKYISFDIFDTLVVRPFHTPSDLLVLLDNKYFELTNSKTSFKKIRIESEFLVRGEVAKRDRNIQDVTITEIYDYISYTYKIDKEVTDKLKEFEISLEVELCTPRKVSKEIFDMLLYVGKDVILVSDMYLEHNHILAILQKNGYVNFKKLYLSSELKKTKGSCELFEIVIQDLNCKPSEIMHLGDNYNSDVRSANKAGLIGVYYPRTLEIFENKVPQIKTNNLSSFVSGGLEHIESFGLAKALIANKMFDNPFVSVSVHNNFNNNRYSFGYYVIGTYLINVLENFKNMNCNKVGIVKNYNYLVYEGLKTLNSYEKAFKEIVPVEITREEILTFILNSEADLLNLPLDYYKYSSEDIVEILQCDTLGRIQTNKTKFRNVVDFHNFIGELIPYYFGDKKLERKIIELENKINRYSDLDFIFDCSNRGNVLDFFNTKVGKLLNYSNIEEVFVRTAETLDMKIMQQGALDFVNDFYAQVYKHKEHFDIDKTEFENVFIKFFGEINNKDKDMFEKTYINECSYVGCSKLSLSTFMKKKDIEYAFQNSEDKSIMEKIINNRKVVCFGSGSSFSNFINKNYNLDVAFILDNDASKRGKFFENYEIKTIGDIDDLNEYFIIITSAYYKEIGEQLVQLGLGKYDDFIGYNDI